MKKMTKMTMTCLLAMVMAVVFFSTASAVCAKPPVEQRPFVSSGWFPTDASSADLVLPDEDGESRLYVKIKIPGLNLTKAAGISFICQDIEDPMGLYGNKTDQLKIDIKSKCVFLHYGRIYPDGRVEIYYYGQYLLRMDNR